MPWLAVVPATNPVSTNLEALMLLATGAAASGMPPPKPRLRATLSMAVLVCVVITAALAGAAVPLTNFNTQNTTPAPANNQIANVASRIVQFFCICIL